jgi:hypothetical protein
MGELARVNERKRAVALARHYRDVEGLSGKEIARRMGRSHATIRSYFYDPDASKARAVKKRYQGRCEGCGAPTSGGDGPGRAKRHCPSCARVRGTGRHRAPSWARGAE